MPAKVMLKRWAESEEAVMGIGKWSMAKDRELIKLSRTDSPEQIAQKLNSSLPQVFKVAKRLGIKFEARPNGRSKAKLK